MLTEQNLVDSEVNAADDMEGLDTLIQNLFNEIAKKRFRIIQLHRDKKSEAALELEVTAKEMSTELHNLIKDQLNYLKYLKARGQASNQNQKSIGKLTAIKNEKSSNGTIVQEIPKH